MNKGYFITDTDLGKTWISLGIVEAKTARQKVSVMKPISASCEKAATACAMKMRCCNTAILNWITTPPLIPPSPCISPYQARCPCRHRNPTPKLANNKTRRLHGSGRCCWVANQVSTEMNCLNENIKTLQQMIDTPMLGQPLILNDWVPA